MYQPKLFTDIESNSFVISSELKKQNFSVFSHLCKTTFRETYPEQFDETELETFFGASYINSVLPDEMASSSVKYLFATLNGHLIGYAKLIFDENVAKLSKIYFLNEYQGKGYGKKLLAAALNAAVDANFTIMHLYVWQGNPAAYSFYKHYQFEVQGQEELCFGGKKFIDNLMVNNDITALLASINGNASSIQFGTETNRLQLQ